MSTHSICGVLKESDHLGRDDNRANQLSPNHEQYWRTRGGRPAPSEGGGWSFLLTVVGVAAAALAAVAVAASAVSAVSAASVECSSRAKGPKPRRRASMPAFGMLSHVCI